MHLHGHSRHDRRAPGTAPLRAGALRCEGCGTTWFDHVAAQLANGWARCRRCGGTLHGERREAGARLTRVA
jgi:hypothetical protein